MIGRQYPMLAVNDAPRQGIRKGKRMHEILHLLWHALADTLKLLPFLFAAYLLLEYIEHRSSKKLAAFLSSEKFGIPGGALLGCIPQCGISVASAHMFARGLIGAGTLVAVIVSTSDEAVPILLANVSSIDKLLPLILGKVAFAVAMGYLFEFTLGRIRFKPAHVHSPEGCPVGEKIESAHSHECSHGCDGNILKSSLLHTLETGAFILAVNVAAEFAVHFIGKEEIAAFLSSGELIAPLLAAIVGLIPSCASSVIITELYIDGMLSLGAAFAGLSVGSGVGIAALFSANKNIKQNLLIVLFIFVFSILAGYLIQVIA